MKILVIPDLHGDIDFLNKVAQCIADVDHTIFLGDYFDPRNKKYQGFDRIMKFSNRLNEIVVANRDHIDLICGNHEFRYIPVSEGGNFYCRYSVLNTNYGAGNLDAFLNSNFRKDLKFAVKYDKFIFSHAGVRAGLLNKNFFGKTTFNLWNDINGDIDKSKDLDSICEVGSARSGNWYGMGGTAWIDYEAEFLNNMNNEPEGLFQFMGHTRVKGLVRSSYGSMCLDAGQTAYAIVDTETDEINLFAQEHQKYKKEEVPFRINFKNILV